MSRPSRPRHVESTGAPAIRRRRWATRPPPPAGRALPALGPGRAADVMPACGRITRRLPVPGFLLDMVRYGSEHPDRVCEHWWQTVEDRTEAWVLSRVPSGAARLRIALDAARLEVVVAYTPPGRACG